MNMSTTNIIIGFSAGAVVAIALYYYFSRRKNGQIDDINSQSTEEDPTEDFEFIDSVSYDMLLAWLRHEHKSIKFGSGDQFFILQDPIARESFIKVFPKMENNLTDSYVLCAGIMRGDDIISSKFFIYKKMAESLSELLPKDPNKSFIQKIED